MFAQRTRFALASVNGYRELWARPLGVAIAIEKLISAHL